MITSVACTIIQMNSTYAAKSRKHLRKNVLWNEIMLTVIVENNITGQFGASYCACFPNSFDLLSVCMNEYLPLTMLVI